MKTNPPPKLKSSEAISCKHILDEMVILQHSTGDYWSLNATGTAIWKFCKEPKTENEIIRFISDEFKVDPQSIQKNISDHIQLLLGHKLLNTVSPT